MARTKTTPTKKLENLIRSKAWYNYVKSVLGAKSNYEIAKKIGDEQGSKWAGYEKGTINTSSTSVANVELGCSGSSQTFHEGPENSRLFICMFHDLKELGVLKGEDHKELLSDYVAINSRGNSGIPFSLNRLTKKDFDKFTKELISLADSSNELLALFSVHVLLLRIFVQRSESIHADSTAVETILKMTVMLLARDSVFTKLKDYGIYPLICEWLLNLSMSWLNEKPELEVTLTLDAFLQDPTSLIFEVNKAVFIKELTENPSGKYDLSHDEKTLIF